MLLPCTTGRLQCRWCQVDIPWTKWRLCASCEAEAICWKCGVLLGEYRPDELCDGCYATTPFHYRLIRKGGYHGTVAK